jgi:hypothetical protein
MVKNKANACKHKLLAYFNCLHEQSKLVCIYGFADLFSERIKKEAVIKSAFRGGNVEM